MIPTHEHADHLDPDAIPVIARNNPAPAAESVEGRNRSCDRSQLWAFGGGFEEIRARGRTRELPASSPCVRVSA